MLWRHGGGISIASQGAAASVSIAYRGCAGMASARAGIAL